MAIVLNTHAPFAVPIHEWTDVLSDKENKQLENYALKLEKNTSSNHISNVGGFQSHKKNPETTIELKPLYKKLDHCFNEFASHMKYKTKIGAQLDEGWFNINRKDNYNVWHTHPRSDFACCYYIKTPKNSGNIIFKNPIAEERHANYFEYTNYHCFNSIDYSIKPKESKLLIWPGYMQHMVETSKTNEARISFSLNLKIYYV